MSKLQIIKPVFVLFIIGFSVLACKNDAKLKYQIPTPSPVEAFIIHADSIKLEGDIGNFSVNKSISTETEGVQLITFTFSANESSELQPVSIKFNFPSIDINAFWNPKISIDKVNYYYSGITSKASRYAPVLSFYNNALTNRITIALSDALNQSEIVSYLREEDVHFYPEIKLFQEKMPRTTSYSISLRIDTRPIPYYKSIDEVASWWVDFSGYKPMSVPETAKVPMYSTWYSYHQSISADEIVVECKIAKPLGCGAVIVDDGWQTMDGNYQSTYHGTKYSST